MFLTCSFSSKKKNRLKRTSMPSLLPIAKILNKKRKRRELGRKSTKWRTAWFLLSILLNGAMEKSRLRTPISMLLSPTLEIPTIYWATSPWARMNLCHQTFVKIFNKRWDAATMRNWWTMIGCLRETGLTLTNDHSNQQLTTDNLYTLLCACYNKADSICLINEGYRTIRSCWDSWMSHWLSSSRQCRSCRSSCHSC